MKNIDTLSDFDTRMQSLADVIHSLADANLTTQQADLLSRMQFDDVRLALILFFLYLVDPSGTDEMDENPCNK